MRCFPRLRRSRAFSIQAFTLIELLVVISIIAVLAGLLLPVAGRVSENARRVSAKAAMMHIVTAVKSYQSDYGVYPVAVTTTAAGTAPTDTTYDDTTHNGTLFKVLRNMQVGDSDPAVAAMNSRRTVYFEYKDVKNAAAPRDGFVPAPATGSTTPSVGANKITMKTGDLVDPWGNLYRVRIDTGYTDKVVDPFQVTSSTADDTVKSDGTSDPADSYLVHTSVIAWSIGQNSTQYDATKTTPTYDASGNVATWR